MQNNLLSKTKLRLINVLSTFWNFLKEVQTFPYNMLYLFHYLVFINICVIGNWYDTQQQQNHPQVIGDHSTRHRLLWSIEKV